MEALGYLPEPIMADVKAPVTADIAAPILRETVSRVVDDKVATMYKDELEKILYKDLYSHLGLQFVYGIVEFKDGVRRVDPVSIKFCDEENADLCALVKHNEALRKGEEQC
mgnify:CR=1 FL=1|jgi:hypothetical protein